MPVRSLQFVVRLREAVSSRRGSFRRLIDEVGVAPEASDDTEAISAPHSPAPLRPNHKLSLAEIDRLVDGYRRGATIYELAGQLGIHRQTVSAHLHRKGVVMRSRVRVTRALLVRAIELYEAGWSTTDIGKELRLGASTVGKALKRAGVPMRTPVAKRWI